MLPVILKRNWLMRRTMLKDKETSTKLRKFSHDAMTKVSERGDKLEETYLT